MLFLFLSFSSALRPLVFPSSFPPSSDRPLCLFRDRSRILKRRSHRIITQARFEPPSPSCLFLLLLLRLYGILFFFLFTSTPSLSCSCFFFFFAAYISSCYRGSYEASCSVSLFLSSQSSTHFLLPILFSPGVLSFFMYRPIAHVVNEWRYFDRIQRDREIIPLVSCLAPSSVSLIVARAFRSPCIRARARARAISWGLISVRLRELK